MSSRPHAANPSPSSSTVQKPSLNQAAVPHQASGNSTTAAKVRTVPFVTGARTEALTAIVATAGTRLTMTPTRRNTVATASSTPVIDRALQHSARKLPSEQLLIREAEAGQIEVVEGDCIADLVGTLWRPVGDGLLREVLPLDQRHRAIGLAECHLRGVREPLPLEDRPEAWRRGDQVGRHAIGRAR